MSLLVFGYSGTEVSFSHYDPHQPHYLFWMLPKCLIQYFIFERKIIYHGYDCSTNTRKKHPRDDTTFRGINYILSFPIQKIRWNILQVRTIACEKWNESIAIKSWYFYLNGSKTSVQFPLSCKNHDSNGCMICTYIHTSLLYWIWK